MSSSEWKRTALLEYIHEQRGVDFRDYRPTTLRDPEAWDSLRAELSSEDGKR